MPAVPEGGLTRDCTTMRRHHYYEFRPDYSSRAFKRSSRDEFLDFALLELACTAMTCRTADTTKQIH